MVHTSASTASGCAGSGRPRFTPTVAREADRLDAAVSWLEEASIVGVFGRVGASNSCASIAAVSWLEEAAVSGASIVADVRQLWAWLQAGGRRRLAWSAWVRAPL